MVTKRLYSKEQPTLKEIEIDIKKARLKNMFKENTKTLAVIIKLMLKDKK